MQLFRYDGGYGSVVLFLLMMLYSARDNKNESGGKKNKTHQQYDEGHSAGFFTSG